jgi:hypothetical protein
MARDRDRDLALAVLQLESTIQRQLSLVPPGCVPVQGLTPAMLRNLAATITQALDEYGYEDDEPEDDEPEDDEPEDERARLEAEWGASEFPWERHP